MGCHLARFMNNKVTDTTPPDNGRNDQDGASTPSKSTSTEVWKQGATSSPSSPSMSIRSPAHPVITVTCTASDKLMARVTRATSTPLLKPQRERSSSQIEFFRALDEKINRGRQGESDDNLSRCSTLSA
ncbi:uncharacterized protein LOC144180153 isoform X1 [Haemaphysalis longicornis]